MSWWGWGGLSLRVGMDFGDFEGVGQVFLKELSEITPPKRVASGMLGSLPLLKMRLFGALNS